MGVGNSRIRVLTVTWRTLASTLFSEDLLHLADFLLDFSAYLFILAVGFQVGIARQSSCLLLNLTLHFVNLARYLILSTWLHLVASFHKDSDSGARLNALRLHRAPQTACSENLALREQV